MWNMKESLSARRTQPRSNPELLHYLRLVFPLQIMFHNYHVDLQMKAM